MLMVASGSAERRFPGPRRRSRNVWALASAPALDLPMASAGSLFGLSLAAQLAAAYGNILVIACGAHVGVVLQPPMERGVSILFGDGAGACLVSATEAKPEWWISDSTRTAPSPRILSWSSAASGDERALGDHAGLAQDPARHCRAAGAQQLHGRDQVGVFLMHQANQNLIARVAQALGVAEEKFYTNIRRFGNTSSASMLIAAAEWFRTHRFQPGEAVCFAAFGAGFHWGALLAQGV